MHNTQPWLFRLGEGRLDVFADPDRQLPVADPTGTPLRMSCGAAVFNLRLAVHQLGYAPANPLETQLYQSIPRPAQQPVPVPRYGRRARDDA